MKEGIPISREFEIESRLNINCYNVAEILLDADVCLTSEILEVCIPGHAHALTVGEGVLPEPHDIASGVWLGDVVVDVAYRDNIRALMEPALKDIRRIAADRQVRRAFETIDWWEQLLYGSVEIGDNSGPLDQNDQGAEPAKARQIPETKQQRKVLVEMFLQDHKHPRLAGPYRMWELHDLAGVSRRAFDGWMRGDKKYPNKSASGERILRLLLDDRSVMDPRKLKPRPSRSPVS